MHGEFKVGVKNSRNAYNFSLRRNITILKGESGRGKTTLFELIFEHNRFGKESGVRISCDRELIAVTGDNWEEEIRNNPGSIIVIDEDSKFIRSEDFAKTVKGSDNYFLLITRNYLAQLPISVDEIFELEGKKNKRFKKIYTDVDKMYDNLDSAFLPVRPQVIITEDSEAGYQFFEKIAEECGIQCISAKGKSNVFNVLKSYSNKEVVVIADGAAFGSEIEEIAKFQRIHLKSIGLYLPECFEWVILKSGVLSLNDNDMLNSPEKYADSVKYMSWEQYFVDLLKAITKHSKYKNYKKDKLPEFYFKKSVVDEIKQFIKGIDFISDENSQA